MSLEGSSDSYIDRVDFFFSEKSSNLFTLKI